MNRCCSVPLRVIEDVETLRPKLDGLGFANGKVLEQPPDRQLTAHAENRYRRWCRCGSSCGSGDRVSSAVPTGSNLNSHRGAVIRPPKPRFRTRSILISLCSVFYPTLLVTVQ